MISKSGGMGAGLIPSIDILSLSITQTNAPTIDEVKGPGCNVSVGVLCGSAGIVIAPQEGSNTKYYGGSMSIGIFAKSPLIVNGLGSADVDNTSSLYEGNIYEVISDICGGVIRWCE